MFLKIPTEYIAPSGYEHPMFLNVDIVTAVTVAAGHAARQDDKIRYRAVILNGSMTGNLFTPWYDSAKEAAAVVEKTMEGIVRDRGDR